MNRILPTLLACVLAFLTVPSARCAPKGNTLDDLKKLDIICLVPGWLPDGYRLRKVAIDYSDREQLKDKKTRGFPAYSVEYSNGKKGSFTIECARWGIGDRNLDQDERAEETHFETKLFGPIYIIYFPPKENGVKQRINANWIEDDNIKTEKVKTPEGIWIKGRYHGISGFGMTIADFEKIVRSLHPIRGN